ncbi:cation-translocating P-type ATPase [Candidatus Roizmanbacteria bacterium]|nr:cation-translocating P-type ATPase [Candidatus Roizmanbacteria bacterium]
MKGLNSKEAERLLNQYGFNEIKEQKKKLIIIKFIEQFNNFLIILLILAAVLSVFIGEEVDAILILSIVFLNALFGLYQESKAEQAISLLRKMTITKVRVIRDGKEQEIDSRHLVPGDIFFIEEGLKISADAKVLEERNLEVNEASLTGESLPVIKKTKNAIFMGTIVAKGRGYAEVIATGMKTKFGQIARNIETIKEIKTPLQKKLEGLTKIIGIAGILLSVLVFILSLLQGTGNFPAFLLAVSLAVAVVPEGLPAVMTITMAIGVKEMAKRKAIIRKLSAIEALGSVTLIATDKTGTLTTNKMEVKDIFVDNFQFPISLPRRQAGNFQMVRQAHHPEQSRGTNFKSQITNFRKNASHLLLLNGILCSTASLVFVHDHGGFDVLGDPTEGALLYLGQKMGLMPEEIRKQWRIIDEAPFDSVTKRMSVLVQKSNQSSVVSNQQKTKKLKTDNRQLKTEYLVFSKGAPESILEICDSILIGEKHEELTPAKVKAIEETMEKWAKKGLRVLAFAYAKSQIGQLSVFSNQQKTEKPNTKSRKLVFLGMVAIHDPPRPEVIEALRKTREAGIKVVMITGDNEVTAEAIGVSTGLIKEGDEIMTGKLLDEYSDEDLIKKLSRVKVFARTTPLHKSRIVKLYQEMGEVVAVTGDGVNDAVALKQADVGIAMGLIGTDVARETADMVITDDNFATIVNAVEEGRNIIKNLKNSIKYLLSCNMSEALSLLTALLLGIPNLFFAIQLLYINLVTDGVPALALAFSPREEHIMRQPPLKDLELLPSFGRRYIFTVGILATVIVVSSYFLFSDGEEFRRTAAFSVLALIQSFILIDLWLSHQSIRKHYRRLISPIFLLAFSIPFVGQYLLLKIPSLAFAFKIETVSTANYLVFIFLASLILFGVKAVKILLRR